MKFEEALAICVSSHEGKVAPMWADYLNGVWVPQKTIQAFMADSNGKNDIIDAINERKANSHTYQSILTSVCYRLVIALYKCVYNGNLSKITSVWMTRHRDDVLNRHEKWIQTKPTRKEYDLELERKFKEMSERAFSNDGPPQDQARKDVREGIDAAITRVKLAEDIFGKYERSINVFVHDLLGDDSANSPALKYDEIFELAEALADKLQALSLYFDFSHHDRNLGNVCPRSDIKRLLNIDLV